MTLDYPVPFHTPNLVWDSTIAIYLFLLGISSGAVQLAIAYKRSHKLENPSKNWIIRAAAVLGSVPTLIGLTLLIFHLARPWTFWKLMFNYQFNSVMSMGVMLFQVYMLFLVCWCAVIFKEDIMALIQRFMPKLGFVGKIINVLERLTGPVEVILFILAAVLGAYTGFLLSALISYPMLNNPVLPALFLASGTSSGIAATFLFILIAGKLKGDSHESHFIHKFEVPIMVTELGFINLFLCWSLFRWWSKSGCLTECIIWLLGCSLLDWGILNWYLNSTTCQPCRKDNLKYNKNFIILVSIFDLIGVLCLRYFILYAGQLTVA